MKLQKVGSHFVYPDLLSAQPTLVEAGIYTGHTIMAWVDKYNGTAIGLEADPQLAAVAIDRLRKAGILERMSIRNEALCGTPGPVVFYIFDTRRQSNSVICRALPGRREVTAQGVTLLQIIDSEVDLLAIDIEGAEWEVLRTCPAETWDWIRQVSIELHTDIGEGSVEEATWLLEVAGYAVHLKKSDITRVDLAGYSLASPLRRRTNRWIRKQLKGKTFDTVLNTGCGSDDDSQGDQYSNYFQCQRMITLDNDPKCKADITASVEDIPLEDNSVDCVFANWVIYKADIRKSLAEFARVLRPGGVVLVSYNGASHNMPGLREAVLAAVEVEACCTMNYTPKGVPKIGEVVCGCMR